MGTKKKPLGPRETAQDYPMFARVIDAFAGDRKVSRGEGKGFGSGALKVDGKIFAMMSSKGEFVVKLPKFRVDQLVDRGQGRRFDPGRGRLMREWLVVESGTAQWVELAREAYRFVKHAQ
jgi:hypothetical protein